VGGPAIYQIRELPVSVWVLITMGIAFAEAYRIQKGWANPFESNENWFRLKKGYYPGDLGFDPLGLAPTEPRAFRRYESALMHAAAPALLTHPLFAPASLTGCKRKS
jgi:hypothetical protein